MLFIYFFLEKVMPDKAADCRLRVGNKRFSNEADFSYDLISVRLLCGDDRS